MAWNGSDQTGRAASTPPDSRARRARASRAPNQTIKQSKNQTIRHGLLALLLIAALASAAVYYFTRPAPPPPPEKLLTSHSSLITSHTPAPARTNAPAAKPTAAAAPAKPVRKGGPGGGRPSRFVNGHYVSPDPAYAEMKKALDEQMAKDPFRYFCENQIYAIVSAEPGNFLLPVPFDENFMREFKESLKTPIVISEDDSDEMKEMKKAVIDAKIWLCDQMAEGKDIKAILTDARDKVNGLSQLQDFYRGEILDMKRDGTHTEAEINDFVDAANKIIDKYAAEKLNFPHPAIKAHVRFVKSPAQARAEAAAKAQKENIQE